MEFPNLGMVKLESNHSVSDVDSLMDRLVELSPSIWDVFSFLNNM